MSDTNPLPAATLLALADAMANAGTEAEYTYCREAYRAARAASPVTLEEALVAHLVYYGTTPGVMAEISRISDAHKDERNARRLAGEGGAA